MDVVRQLEQYLRGSGERGSGFSADVCQWDSRRSSPITESDEWHDLCRILQGDQFIAFCCQWSEVGNWANSNRGECVWVSHWHEKRARLATITTNGALATLTFMAPESTNQFLNQAPNDSNPGYYTWYYFENAYEFLDRKGNGT